MQQRIPSETEFGSLREDDVQPMVDPDRVPGGDRLEEWTDYESYLDAVETSNCRASLDSRPVGRTASSTRRSAVDWGVLTMGVGILLLALSELEDL